MEAVGLGQLRLVVLAAHLGKGLEVLHGDVESLFDLFEDGEVGSNGGGIAVHDWIAHSLVAGCCRSERAHHLFGLGQTVQIFGRKHIY